MFVAGRPRHRTEIPASIEGLAGGRQLDVAWENALGGLTFELVSGSARVFVKWAPAGAGLDLDAEAARLAWAGSFSPVPPLLDRGSDDAGSWIITAPLPGQSAVSPGWTENPAVAVAAIGDGLRRLHDSLPTDNCPFSWSAQDRLRRARRRAGTGAQRPDDWHPTHRSLSVEQALAMVAEPPPVDRLVVCHGDPCAPNTLLHDDGRWSGHVDLGDLGLADRWADLAVATWSTEWNYGPGWERRLLDAYGTVPDPERTRYYRLLWDLA